MYNVCFFFVPFFLSLTHFFRYLEYWWQQHETTVTMREGRQGDEGGCGTTREDVGWQGKLAQETSESYDVSCMFFFFFFFFFFFISLLSLLKLLNFLGTDSKRWRTHHPGAGLLRYQLWRWQLSCMWAKKGLFYLMRPTGLQCFNLRTSVIIHIG